MIKHDHVIVCENFNELKENILKFSKGKNVEILSTDFIDDHICYFGYVCYYLENDIEYSKHFAISPSSLRNSDIGDEIKNCFKTNEGKRYIASLFKEKS